MSQLSLHQLTQSPNVLAQDYRYAQVDLRLMLTGHIHQALPDVAFNAYAEQWDCLNRGGEERFEAVFAKAERVRQGFAGLIDSVPENIALAASLHDLFCRFLSVLPLQQRPRIVTTDSEHPSVARQLARLKESGIEIVDVPGHPAGAVVERVAAALTDATAAVCVSTVNFETGHQVLELDTLLPLCQKRGIELFVDAYQSVNVLSFSIEDYNLGQAFVAGGGAKYCQMGNGNGFMHVPPGRDFRPLITGWYGCFDSVLDNPAAMPLAYADDASRFNGSGYDALPHFRAAHVFDYFLAKGLTPEFLHDVNHHQLTVLAKGFAAKGFDPDIISLTTDVEFMGGFISFTSPYAQKLSEKIRDIGVQNDYRKQWLRFGPAPYLADEQLLDAITALEEAVMSLD